MEAKTAEELRPFVRYAQIIRINDKLEYKDIAAYDFRMFFVRSGEGEIVVDGKAYCMSRGTLISWKPGAVYSLLRGSGNGMELIGLSFDLYFLNSSRYMPVPPTAAEYFCREKIIEPTAAEKIGFLNETVYLTEKYEAELELMRIYTEYKSKLKFFEQRMSGILLSLLIEIARTEESGGGQTHKNENTDEILRFIHENYADRLTNSVIGEKMGYHPNHVNRLVVKSTGMSVHGYLQSFRIERAMDLLQTTDMPIMRICEAVGFQDFTHFSKYFKKKTGYTPTAFRIGWGYGHEK